MNRKFVLVVLLQVFVLVYMSIAHYAVEWYGQEVRLKTAPVDPRDILYGDYVTLSYDISNIDISKFKSGDVPTHGDTIYVLLQKEGEYHQLLSASLNKPSTSADQRVLKGTVDDVSREWDPVLEKSTKVQSVHVKYGLERYYVKEGEGLLLEKKRGQFDVLVKVAPWGQNLSSLKFIANGVITQGEALESVYEYFQKKSQQPIDILSSHLLSQYQNEDRPVWVVEIVFIQNKTTSERAANHTILVIDAKTGQVIEEKTG